MGCKNRQSSLRVPSRIIFPPVWARPGSSAPDRDFIRSADCNRLLFYFSQGISRKSTVLFCSCDRAELSDACAGTTGYSRSFRRGVVLAGSCAADGRIMAGCVRCGPFGGRVLHHKILDDLYLRAVAVCSTLYDQAPVVARFSVRKRFGSNFMDRIRLLAQSGFTECLRPLLFFPAKLGGDGGGKEHRAPAVLSVFYKNSGSPILR